MRRAALAAILSGCSALGLTDGLAQAGGCGDCSELDAYEPPPPCMSWECSSRDPSEGVCVLDLLDGDDDGAPRLDCATDERPGDCDDTAPENRPGGAEICDGLDNDCDDLVDEELTFASRDLTADRSGLEGISWDGPLGAFFDGAALYLVGEGEPVSATLSPAPTIAASPESAVSRGAGAEDVVLLATRDGGCQTLTLGSFARSAPERVSFDPAMVPGGLPKLTACSATGASRVAAPAVATRGARQALALWVEDGGERGCGAGSGSIGAALGYRAAEGELYRAPAAATLLGAHEGVGGPAVLDARDLGFLVARVSAGAIELDLVRVVDGPRGELEVSPAYRERGCEGDCGEVALAWLDGDPPTVGLAYRAGGCDAGEVRLRRLSVEGAVLSAIDPEPVVVGGGPVRRLALAARAQSPSWVVSTWAGDELRVQRVAEGPVGEPLVARAARAGAVQTQRLSVEYDAEVRVRGYDESAASLFLATLSCAPR